MNNTNNTENSRKPYVSTYSTPGVYQVDTKGKMKKTFFKEKSFLTQTQVDTILDWAKDPENWGKKIGRE